MKHTAGIVIIGGGIQGLSLAYHLAIRGITDVVLLEMKALGSGSSGRSAAVIGYAFPSENCLPLVQWSFAAFMRFQDELGADLGYHPIGCLQSLPTLFFDRGRPPLRRQSQSGSEGHYNQSPSESEGHYDQSPSGSEGHYSEVRLRPSRLPIS